MSLTSYQTAPFRYNKCYTLPVHQDCVAIDPRHCVFRRKDKRSLQPQTYFVQYKDIKTADSHTLYTPTISSGVPAFREIKHKVITQALLLDLLNSFGLICIAPDIQWCSAPWGYQSKGKSKLSARIFH